MKESSINQNLNREYEHLNISSINALSELDNFTSFTREFIIQCSNFTKSLQKNIEKFFDKSKLSDVHSQMSINLNHFYQINLSYFQSMKQITDNLSKNLLEPLDKYRQTLLSENIKNLKDLENLINKYKKSKELLSKSQNKYYLSCQNLNKYSDQKGKVFFAKIKAENEVYNKLYKYEITNSNKLYSEFEAEYNEFYTNINQSCKHRLSLFKISMDEYTNSIENINNLTMNLLSQINSKMEQWKLEEEEKIFNNEFNFKKSKFRFQRENFEEYTEDTKIESESDSLLTKSMKLISYLGDNTLIDKYTNKDEYQKKLIDKYINYIDNSNEEMPIYINVICHRIILTDRNFSVLFIKKLYEYVNKKYQVVKNYKNLVHLANIINNIVINSNSNMNLLDYDICMYILFIAQKIYSPIPKNYVNKINKIYLCSILGNNQLYQSLLFWNGLIESRFKKKMEKYLDNLVLKDKEIKKKEEEEAQKNNSNNNSSYSMYSYMSYMGSYMGSGIKNLFRTDQNIYGNNQTDSNKISSNEFAKLLKFIYYDNLNNELKNEFDKMSLDVFKTILNEFIFQFINFRWGVNNLNDYILSICNLYKLPIDLINYYKINIEMSTYSMKQYPINTFENHNIRNKLLYYKSNKCKDKIDDINNNKYICSYENISTIDTKISILKSIIPYLNQNELIYLILLNKQTNQKLSKKVYRHLLENPNIKMEQRLKIWESILHIKKIKSTYDYKSNREKIKSIKYVQKSSAPFSVIDLDVERTSFISNVEQGRKEVNTILKTLSYLNSETSYCQGMNFLASFIYKLTNNNEEQTFYIMMGLFKNTKYLKIFYKDLRILKLYFKVFEKIQKLYLPNIIEYLLRNNIQKDYYSSKWFITLFTDVVDRDNNYIHTVTKIFDYFLIYGWKCIFNVSFILFKLQENEILGMDNEQLLHFLIESIEEKYFLREDKVFFEEFKKVYIKNKMIKSIKKGIKGEEVLNKDKNENLKK